MINLEINNILHQRAPYLMVDKVIELDNKRIRAIKIHHGEEGHVRGHFPGAPIVPGAMLQEICTQSAGILITKFYSPVENYHSKKTKGWALGVLNRVNYAKFLKITKPSLPIEAQVELIDHNENLFKFKGKVFQANELMAKFSFNLVNISDEYLT